MWNHHVGFDSGVPVVKWSPVRLPVSRRWAPGSRGCWPSGRSASSALGRCWMSAENPGSAQAEAPPLPGQHHHASRKQAVAKCPGRPGFTSCSHSLESGKCLQLTASVSSSAKWGNVVGTTSKVWSEDKGEAYVKCLVQSAAHSRCSRNVSPYCLSPLASFSFSFCFHRCSSVRLDATQT